MSAPTFDVIKDPAPPPVSTWTPPLTISDQEWMLARSSPDCIVENYLFADVGVLFAPGGVGKTTLVLYESICIALGLPLYDLEVKKPGPVMILTAEDSREMLIARLRAICAAMELSYPQIRTVRERVQISDVTGSGLRLTRVIDDVVLPTASVDEIADKCAASPPVLIVIDPAVSFGVGESRVNDAEQGLIEAARRLRNRLNCCVRYIHHTGKTNGKEKSLDQYSGRGGSAFSDGARMVHVMQPLTGKEWRERTGQDLAMGETGLILARPKMSYSPPQAEILIRRKGYAYQAVEHAARNSMEAQRERADAVFRLIEDEVKQGHFPTQNSLQPLAAGLGLTRAELRDAVAWLESVERVEKTKRHDTGKGGARTYLSPVSSSPRAPAQQSEDMPKSSDSCAAQKPCFAAPPP